MPQLTDLSTLSLDELEAERQRLQHTLFAPKALMVNLTIVALAIGMGVYAMKDGISYVITAILVWLVYSVFQQFRLRRRLETEIASRRR